MTVKNLIKRSLVGSSTHGTSAIPMLSLVIIFSLINSYCCAPVPAISIQHHKRDDTTLSYAWRNTKKYSVERGFTGCKRQNVPLSEIVSFFEDQRAWTEDYVSKEVLSYMLEIAKLIYGSERVLDPAVISFVPKLIARWHRERAGIEQFAKGLGVELAGSYWQESFFMRHGLRFTSDSLRRYVFERDILDVGAAAGDSLVALSNFTSRRIVSYEIDEKRVAACRSLAERNLTKHLVFHKGLWSAKGEMKYEGRVVELATVDDEVARLGLNVGFLKMDTDGPEEDILRGAIETLRTQRPVLSVAIYHNCQVLRIPQLIAALGGYRLEYRIERPEVYGWFMDMAELRLFAIPAGL